MSVHNFLYFVLNGTIQTRQYIVNPLKNPDGQLPGRAYFLECIRLNALTEKSRAFFGGTGDISRFENTFCARDPIK